MITEHTKRNQEDTTAWCPLKLTSFRFSGVRDAKGLLSIDDQLAALVDKYSVRKTESTGSIVWFTLPQGVSPLIAITEASFWLGRSFSRPIFSQEAIAHFRQLDSFSQLSTKDCRVGLILASPALTEAESRRPHGHVSQTASLPETVLAYTFSYLIDLREPLGGTRLRTGSGLLTPSSNGAYLGTDCNLPASFISVPRVATGIEPTTTDEARWQNPPMFAGRILAN